MYLETCFFPFPLRINTWYIMTYLYQVPKFDPIKCSTIHVGKSIVVPWMESDGRNKLRCIEVPRKRAKHISKDVELFSLFTL